MDILPVTAASIAGRVKAGKLEGLAGATVARVSMLPDVPTVRELGYADIVMSQWNRVVRLAYLPRPLISTLHKAATSAMKQKRAIARVQTAVAGTVFSESPDAYAKYVREGKARWAKIVRDAGVVVK